MTNTDIIIEKQSLELLFCACMDGGTTEDFLALAKQAEKMARRIDPVKTKKILEAERMKNFLEPHFIGTVRKSGDLYISRDRTGTTCYVYFAGKQK